MSYDIYLHYYSSTLVFADEDCRRHVDKRLCSACENWKPSRPGWCIPKMIALFLKDFLLGFGVRLSWFELNCEKLWKNHAIQSHHFFIFHLTICKFDLEICIAILRKVVKQRKEQAEVDQSGSWDSPPRNSS